MTARYAKVSGFFLRDQDDVNSALIPSDFEKFSSEASPAGPVRIIIAEVATQTLNDGDGDIDYNGYLLLSGKISDELREDLLNTLLTNKISEDEYSSLSVYQLAGSFHEAVGAVVRFALARLCVSPSFELAGTELIFNGSEFVESGDDDEDEDDLLDDVDFEDDLDDEIEFDDDDEEDYNSDPF